MSGTWGAEIEVIALATLLKTTIAIYYHPPGAYALMLTHQYVFICTILEIILTMSRLSQVVCNFPFMQSVCTTLCILVVHYIPVQHCINFIISTVFFFLSFPPPPIYI